LPKRRFGSHEPLRDFSKSTATKWSGAAREKIFLKKVLSFSEKGWIGGIDEIVNKILLNTFY
jgi:hypothetical protein